MTERGRERGIDQEYGSTWTGLAVRTLRPRRSGRISPGSSFECLRLALSGSVVQEFLESALSGSGPVTVVINDPERGTATRPALEAFGAAVREFGAAKGGFRVLVATGTHRFAAADQGDYERLTLAGVGLPVVAVGWHESRDDSLHGRAAGGRFHRWVVDASHLVAVGSVEPHYFAGVTGAHKTATVGVMAYEDIEANHRLAMNPEACVLRRAGNPVFEGIARFVEGLQGEGRRVLGINEVLSGDDVLAAEVGSPLETLDRLMTKVRTTYTHELPAPVDILHLRVPPPLGRSLYQADKALKNNARTVRRGGAVLLEADCPYGVGPDSFLRMLRSCPTYADLRRRINEKGYRLGDHKAAQIRYMTDPDGGDVRIAVVSAGLASGILDGTGLTWFPTVDEARDWVLGSTRGVTDVCVIEDAGHVTTSLIDEGS